MVTTVLEWVWSSSFKCVVCSVRVEPLFGFLNCNDGQIAEHFGDGHSWNGKDDLCEHDCRTWEWCAFHL